MTGSITTTVGYWVERIRPSLDRAAQAWIQAGVELIEAKAAAEHGQFGQIVAGLGLSPSSATRIMAIARNPALRDRAQGHDLPSAWRTLSELARLDSDALVGAIGDGRVHPLMTRADAAALVAGDAQHDEDGHLDEQDQARLRTLKDQMTTALDLIRAGFVDAPGVGRLRVLDELLRGIPEADGGDHEIQMTLLALAIDVLDGLPRAEDGDDPIGQLSAAIGATLPHLWSGDGGAIVRALAELTVTASAVPVEVRPDFLLQVLDGRPVDQVHPTTRLVVDALVAGFAA